jgi:hypothetical protein
MAYFADRTGKIFPETRTPSQCHKKAPFSKNKSNFLSIFSNIYKGQNLSFFFAFDTLTLMRHSIIF